MFWTEVVEEIKTRIFLQYLFSKIMPFFR